MFTPINHDSELIENLVNAVVNQIDRQFEPLLDTLASRVPPAGRAAWTDAWGNYVVEVMYLAELVISLGLGARPVAGDATESARQNVKARVIASAQDFREPFAAPARREALEALSAHAPDVARELAEVGDRWLAAVADCAADHSLLAGARPQSC